MSNACSRGAKFMALMVACLPLTACQGPQVRASHEMSDSAGVRVITVSGTAEAHAPWRISRRPIYRTGWEDDEPTFERLWDGVIRDDGAVVVVDYGGHRLWDVSPDGSVVRPVGRRGDGPGEFQSVESVLIDGDSLLAYDTIHRRFTWFKDGQPVKTLTLDLEQSVGYVAPARLTSGSVLMVPTSFSKRNREPGWVTAPILAARGDRFTIDTLAMLPMAWLFARDDDNPLRPFGLARPAGGGWIFAQNDQSEVHWYEVGTLTQIVRWDHSWTEYDEGMWPEIESRIREHLSSSPEVSEGLLERLLVKYREDIRGRVPSFGRLFGDSEGNAWVGSYGFVGAESDSFQVITREGTWLGRVALPRPMKVLAIRDTLLLSVETDEWDIEALALYKIEKR